MPSSLLLLLAYLNAVDGEPPFGVVEQAVDLPYAQVHTVKLLVQLIFAQISDDPRWVWREDVEDGCLETGGTDSTNGHTGDRPLA